MDVVLGVSMAPNAVGMVLLEGEGAGGVTVDQDNFAVVGEQPAAAAADQVIAAILGTRESAAENNFEVRSSGVTWTDPAEADALRDALAARNVENVTLVSAFAAAAALAQSVGSATSCTRTALLFVERGTATLAVVDTADGSIADVRRQPLPANQDGTLAELTALVSGVEAMTAGPQSVFLVGSDPAALDIAAIKSALEATTSLAVTTPEEPELALARGAALASANAALDAPPTFAMARAEDPGIGELAYSADPDPAPVGNLGERHSRKPMLAAVGALTIFVGGMVALAVALALDIRPHAGERPSISRNVVAPATQAPALIPLRPLQPLAPAPPPPSAVPSPPSAQPVPASAPPAVAPQPPAETPPERVPPERPWDRHRRFGRGIFNP